MKQKCRALISFYNYFFLKCSNYYSSSDNEDFGVYPSDIYERLLSFYIEGTPDSDESSPKEYYKDIVIKYQNNVNSDYRNEFYEKILGIKNLSYVRVKERSGKNLYKIDCIYLIFAFIFVHGENFYKSLNIELYDFKILYYIIFGNVKKKDPQIEYLISRYYRNFSKENLEEKIWSLYCSFIGAVKRTQMYNNIVTEYELDDEELEYMIIRTDLFVDTFSKEHFNKFEEENVTSEAEDIPLDNMPNNILDGSENKMKENESNEL